MGIEIRERVGAAPIIDIEAGTDKDVANRTIRIQHVETIRMVLHARERLKVIGNQRNIRRVAKEERSAIRRPAKKITTLAGLAGNTEILMAVCRIVIDIDLRAGTIKNLRVARQIPFGDERSIMPVSGAVPKNITTVVRRERHVCIVVYVQVRGLPNLAQIVDATGASGPLPGSSKRGQEQGRKHADNRNHDEQFNQRERADPPPTM